MSDGFKSAAQLIGEAVVKPVTDEVGKMVEQGVQSITGSQKQDPQNKNDGGKVDPQKIAQDDAAKKQKALANIQRFNQQYQQQAQIVQQKKIQADQERNQQKAEEVQKVRQFEFAKKQQQNEALKRQQTRSERKIGGAG